MIALSVNINKIALIRNSREGNNPDLINYALRCIQHGAQGITVHPRPDQRHIRASDCLSLKKAIQGSVEFNIEGNPLAPATPSNQDNIGDYPGFLELVAQSKPEQCTLVPDSDQQLTSDHGFNLLGDN
ncbi:MAG: pyridoxine 5'-phosphate synthase, partial [Sinobacterium sp.]|nr:pyridoxine 5'-phosphate synthase [Sinobacterium sp.]